MGVCGSTKNTNQRHGNSNNKGKTIDNKVEENKNNQPIFGKIVETIKEVVVVENKDNKPKDNTVNNNTNVAVNKETVVDNRNNNEVVNNNNNVVVEAEKNNAVIDAKDLAYNSNNLITNNTIEEGGETNINIKEKETVHVENLVSAVDLGNTNLTLDKNFVNTSITELNYSAKRITKYYKGQEKYDLKEEYTDDFFPPTLNSIFGLDENNNPVDLSEKRRTEAEESFQIDKDDIEWLRPREIFGPNYALFEGKIEFDDVRQGSIGNCYFMASISALTECPQIIAEIFRQHKVQKNGRYEICLKLDGEWNVVIVDDLIPCSKKTRKPIFAKPKGNELWAILLEKAWAKVNGGYINTVAGMASEVIECLVNFPYEYNETSNAIQDEQYKEDLWAKIVQASMNEYIMTTSLPSREGAKELGLVEGHEYTLIEGRELEYNGNRIRLVKIRNPWGSIKFTGNWSQSSDLWDDNLKTHFNFDDVYNEDGEFYISFDDFIYFFADVDICKIEERICMKQSSIAYEDFNRNGGKAVPKVFELHIHEETNVNITIFKPYYRFVRELPSDWTVHQQLLIAKCEDESTLTFSEFWGNCEAQKDCHIGLRLLPGTYFIIAFVDFSTAKEEDNLLAESLLPKLKHNINICCSEFFEFHEKGYSIQNAFVL